jgi:Cytochrome c
LPAWLVVCLQTFEREFPVSVRRLLMLAAVGLSTACQAGQPAAPSTLGDPAAGQPVPGTPDAGQETPLGPDPGSSLPSPLPPDPTGPDPDPTAPLPTEPLEPYDAPPLGHLDRTFATRSQRTLPAISGGTLASISSTRLVAADPDRDRVLLIDLAEGSVRSVALEPGDEPGRVATHGARAYVALRGAGALVTLDLENATLTARSAVCSAPRGVVHDGARSRVLVACARGELVALSEDGARVLSSTFVESDLRDVGVDGGGVWVTRFRRPALLRLDEAGGVVSRQEPAEIAVSLTQFAGATPTVSTFSPALAFRSLALADGTPLMLHQRAQSSTITVGNFQSYGGSQFNGSFCESGIVHTTLTRFGAAQPEPLPALPQAVLPVDLAASPDARLLVAVAPGNFARQDIVEQVNGFGEGPLPSSLAAQQLYFFSSEQLDARAAGGVPADGPFENGARDCLGDAPRWEHRFPGEAIAVQFLAGDAFAAQVRNPAELHVFRLDEAGAPRLTQVIELGGEALNDTGHQVFHQNAGAGIACASCHAEGLEDGHVWQFSDVGARRTQSLRGNIVQTAPFHWAGEFSDFALLTDEIFGRRMGGGLLGDEWRGALQGWLGGLDALPAQARDPAAAARGRALFESAGAQCSSCHAGTALRSDGHHDVGTGGTFEVPSLRGAALRLPLMHNGCATTLRARFEPSCGGGDAHGRTSQLSAAQLDDLVAYLESL